jgi:hypothetical protein
MGQDMEALYQARLRRYVTALNNLKPDRVPVRPFAAEFTGRHAGYTCQQLTQHYPDAFEAMVRCCNDYDWDAVPASMVYVWTGITDAAGVRYYGVPGWTCRRTAVSNTGSRRKRRRSCARTSTTA